MACGVIMLDVSFSEYGKHYEFVDCYGISFSPAWRIMYVKFRKKGRVVKQAFFMHGVSDLRVTVKERTIDD